MLKDLTVCRTKCLYTGGLGAIQTSVSKLRSSLVSRGSAGKFVVDRKIDYCLGGALAGNGEHRARWRVGSVGEGKIEIQFETKDFN